MYLSLSTLYNNNKQSKPSLKTLHMCPQTTHAAPFYDQESMYWSMNLNSYKFGFSGLESASYYSPYEVSDHLSRMDVSRTIQEYPSLMNTEEPPTTSSQLEGDPSVGIHATLGECSTNHRSTETSQATWQDGIDLDNDLPGITRLG